MNSDVKRQVFDVLNANQLRINPTSNGAWLMLKRSTGSHWWDMATPELIPDDIETLMLDWLEEGTYFFSIGDGKGFNQVFVDALISGDNKFHNNCESFEWDKDTPRPVAIAQAVVWVFNQINDNKEESK